MRPDRTLPGPLGYLAFCPLPSAILLAGLVLLIWPRLAAQQPVTGTIYFAVENRATGSIEQRGLAGDAGVAFDQLILAPDTDYRVWLLEAATLRVADLAITSPPNGQRAQLSTFVFRDVGLHDLDGDDLPDLAESIVGTSPTNPDTDGDGLRDGPEVVQGEEPLSGQLARTGLIASVDLPGTAVDICALNDIAIIGNQNGSVSVFNVFNGMDPVVIAQVTTPGRVKGVACTGSLIPVVLGRGGLAIIDVSDPPAARVLHRVGFESSAEVVVAGAGLAFVGLSSGEVAVVDCASGFVLSTSRTPAGRTSIHDLALAGDHLYSLTQSRLDVLRYASGRIEPVSFVTTRVRVNRALGRARLFVGDGIAYVTHGQGFNTIDVSDPEFPQIIAESINAPTGQFGWKQMVANGSGLGIATVGANSDFNGEHHVQLYDISDPQVIDNFVARHDTPGIARAVSLYNGIAYVADHFDGLQVINYLSADTAGVAPAISLSGSYQNNQVEAGQAVRVSAGVSDDVQVRNVEFYLDGNRIATDGNFPFEIRFPAPLRRAGKTSFVIRARASDTGGNATWSEEIQLDLLPDTTAPVLLGSAPRDGAVAGAVTTVLGFFSELLATATVNSTSFQLVEAGSDGVFDTGDDVSVSPRATEFVSALTAARLTFDNPLPDGRYRATVGTSIQDRTGNPVAQDESWEFFAFTDRDQDGDGLADGYELALGLDPLDEDTDDNGTLDGAEDHDGDSVPNAVELRLGFNALATDSDLDGIPDNEEDRDNDFLPDVREVELGTAFGLADTDEDGWNDESEVTANADPLDPTSFPLTVVRSSPTNIYVPQIAPGPDQRGPTTYRAQPPVTIEIESP